MQSLFEKFDNQSVCGLDITRIVSLVSSSELDIASLEVRCGEMKGEIAAHVQACIKQAGLTGPELDGSNPIEPYLAAFLQRSDNIFAAGIIWGRILQHSITLFGPLDERTLEVLRSMLRKGAHVFVTKEMSDIAEALKQTYGPENPDYMLCVCEMITALCRIPAEGRDDLLLGYITEVKGPLDSVKLDYRTSSIELALKVSLGLVVLDQLDAAQLLLDRAYAALPTGEEVVLVSPAIQLYKVVRMSLLRKSGKHEEFRKVAQEYIKEEEQGQKENTLETIHVARMLLADSYWSQKRWKDAAIILEASLANSKRTLGPLDMRTQVLGIWIAKVYILDNSDNLEASKEKIRKIIKLQREFEGLRCRKTVMVEMAAAMAYNDVGQHRLSFELYKESYSRHCKWLRPDDGFQLNLEDEYAMSLTRVPDRSASEIDDITEMFMDRISSFEGKYGDSPAKLKLADFWFGVKYYEKVLELLKTTIDLKEHAYTNYDKAKIPPREQTLIASCYRSLGLWDQAMSWYCDIVESQKRYRGKADEEEVALNLVYYAHACKNSGNWKKAEDAYQQIFDFRISAYGQQHEKTITAMEWLAHNAKDAGLLPKAEKHFQQILAAKQKAFGNNDKILIPTLLHLANVMVLQKTSTKFEEAENHLRRVVNLSILHESTSSKGVADTKKRLGDFLFQQGRYLEALPLRQDVLGWHEKNHGHDAKSTIDSLYDLADTQLFNHNRAEALQGLVRVLNWRRVAFGDDVIATLVVVQRIGIAHLGQQQFEAALPFLIKAADGLPLDETMSALEEVAKVAKLLKRWSVVEKYRLRMLKCMEDSGQPSPIHAILSQKYSLAIARLQQGRAAEAEADLAKVLEMNQQDDPGSLSTALSCYWYAESQTLLQKHKIAAEHYAIFVSYQREVPTSHADSWCTWGRSWAGLQARAWEELDTFYSKNNRSCRNEDTQRKG
jgi:tetratricopeptide (TPR) repeat protein